MKMIRVFGAALPLLFTAAAAIAQSPQSSIRESTDPARIAEVERRAQELRGGQSTTGARGQSQTPQSAAGKHGRMHHHGMQGHGRMHHQGMPEHHGRRHGHHGGQHDHPKAAPRSGK